MSRHGNPPIRLALYLLIGGVTMAAAAHAQQAQAGTTAPARSRPSAAARQAIAGQKGIWKWVVPPVRMKGGFDDHDPIGLVAGKLIPADCSFNWTDPDTHKLYCFTSATSLVYFLDAPQTYLAKAQKEWLALKDKASKDGKAG